MRRRYNSYNRDPYETKAKYATVCPGCGKAIKKGDTIYIWPSAARGQVDGLDYIGRIDNDQLWTWTRDEVLREYIELVKAGNKYQVADKFLKDAARRLCLNVIAVEEYHKQRGVKLYQEDIDELTEELRELANMEMELGSLGIM